MNKPARILTGLAALGLAAGTAVAMEPYLPRAAKSFSSLDADSNGKVTLAELQPRAEKRFLKLDGDQNGEVSAAEIEAVLHKALELRRNRVLKAMDQDGSGAISKGELDRFVAALIDGADADHDGGVTRDEIRMFRVAKAAKPATGESSN